MNSKQRKTLEAVFAPLASKTLEWAAIESLLKAAGCAVIEGNGSRVGFLFDQRNDKGDADCRIRCHFPSPPSAKETEGYQLRQPCNFLALIGVTP